MSIQTNEQMTGIGEFAEGSIVSLAKGTWFCVSHSLTVKIGRECGFCVYETLGEPEFELWASKQHVTHATL